ncbi:MAG: NTP transferase domain-containing protein [Candidatus Omnitrophica bacterium]|nr:NTP transferase domain-containing protein [Candidatus Omnitrophota bacterium]
MKDMTAVILAAGKGTRMKSDTPKVLHELLGKPMLRYVIDAVKASGISRIIVVIGHGSGAVRDILKTEGVTAVEQKRLLGSGDAVMTAKKALGPSSGDILVICGDTPLIRKETVRSIIEKHKSSGASATILTAILKDPTGYGRIVRGSEGRIAKIVEDQEASLYEEVIEEINVGTYCFKSTDLFAALARVSDDNRKKEYFLTDVIGVLSRNDKTIESVTAEDKNEIIGINSRKDLAYATQAMKTRVMDGIMAGGVTVQDPLSTVIYPDVSIGRDTVIYSNTVIQSDVTIGSSCKIGPFTRIRPGVIIGDRVEVGNFVELVKTRIGDDTKVKHHTYLGNTTVGKKVNIGAGTITANFDGKNKNETVIEDGAFIGVGAMLVAPVKVGKEAVVGAGCVVLKGHDVPRKATAVGVPSRILKKK